MAPKVSKRGGAAAAAAGAAVGATRLFKKKAHMVAAYHLGRSIEFNETFAQIQQVPFCFSVHGLFGKKICKKFKGPVWDPTLLSEDFKFCLRERWANCEPNNQVTNGPRRHLLHHNCIWEYEYKKHFPDLGMSQKEYLVFTINNFNSVRVKLNNALYQSVGKPINRSGLRPIDTKQFLDKLKRYGLIPSLHSRYFRMENKVKVQLLTEVHFYFEPERRSLMKPPTWTMKNIRHYNSKKPLFVI